MIELVKKYPCRTGFIKNLWGLISNSAECFPPAIFVYGHAGTGKTVIVKDILRLAKSRKHFHGAYVNCVECYTITILLESSVEELIFDNGKCRNLRCDGLKEFVESLKNENSNTIEEGYVLALDNAERLRDMAGNVMPTLLRLQEITGLNICVVLISQIPFEKYYSKTGLTEVITLHCPQYSKAETLKILSAQLEMTKQMLRSHIIKYESMDKRKSENNVELLRKINIVNTLTSEFFNNYLNVFLSVFYKACRDLLELKITSCKCFLIYIEPVFQESVDIRDVSKLWRNIAAPLRVALSTVYLRYGKTEKNVHTKQKLRRNKNDIGGTGGGPSKFNPLSPLEEQVVKLLNMEDSVNGLQGALSFGTTTGSAPEQSDAVMVAMKQLDDVPIQDLRK